MGLENQSAPIAEDGRQQAGFERPRSAARLENSRPTPAIGFREGERVAAARAFRKFRPPRPAITPTATSVISRPSGSTIQSSWRSVRPAFEHGLRVGHGAASNCSACARCASASRWPRAWRPPAPRRPRRWPRSGRGRASAAPSPRALSAACGLRLEIAVLCVLVGVVGVTPRSKGPRHCSGRSCVREPEENAKGPLLSRPLGGM